MHGCSSRMGEQIVAAGGTATAVVGALVGRDGRVPGGVVIGDARELAAAGSLSVWLPAAAGRQPTGGGPVAALPAQSPAGNPGTARSRAFTIAVDQSTAGRRLPLNDFARAAGQAGIPVLEVPSPAVAAYAAAHGPHAVSALLERHRVRIGQVSSSATDLSVAQWLWPAAAAAWRDSCRLAAWAGAQALSLSVPSTVQGAAADAQLLADRLASLADVAARYGLAVHAALHHALLGDTGNWWRETVAAGGANVRLLVDVAGLALAGLDPVGYITGLPHGAIGWVHVADLPPGALPPAGHTWARRVLPGAGRLPLDEVLEALRGAGFAGRVTLKVPRAEPCPRETAEHLARAAAALTRGALAPHFAGGLR